MSIIVEAIRNLAPNAEFSFSGNDLTTLDWQSTSITKPSLAAIEAEIIRQNETK